MRRLILLFTMSLCFLPLTVMADDVLFYGQVLGEEVPAFNEADEQIGTLNINGRNVTYSDNGLNDRVLIHIGNTNTYIDRQFIQQSTQEVPPSSKVPLGSVKSLNTFTIFEKTSKESTVLFTGTDEFSFEVLSVLNGYYEVEVAGLIGFLPVSQAKPLFTDEDLYFNVIQDSLPYYEMKNNVLVKRGSFSKGTRYSRVKESAGYHVVKFDTRTFYVPEQGTLATKVKPVVKGPAKAKFPIKVLPEKEVDVLNVNGDKIGTISRGSFVDIYSLVKGKAVVNFFGQEGRADMSAFVHTNLLSPKKNVSHAEMSYLVQVFAAMYPEFMKLEQIGKSVEGRPIYAIRLGNGKKEVLFDASLHAREHMSTNVVMEMLDTYGFHYLNKTKYAGFNVRSSLDAVSIWFVPMMNPDGVTLVQSGAKAVKNGSLATRINGSSNFARWKANVRGVDLNDNFDANWNKVKSSTKKPAFQGYGGPRAFSEPESVALRDFVRRHSFKTYISYHSSGQVVYWFQWQKGAQAARDITLARRITSLTGYSIVPPMYLPGSGSSADWFIHEKKMPGLTIEISPYVGNRPIPLKYWDRIWKQNHKVGLFVAQDAAKR